MAKKAWISIVVVAAAALILFVIIRISAGVLSGLPKAAMGDDAKAIKVLQDISVKNAGSPKAEKALYRLASIYEKRGNLVAARDTYQKLIDVYPDSRGVARAEAKRGELNIKVLFSPLLADGAIGYKVQTGDTLSRIAKRFDTTVDLIAKANGLTGTGIMAGQTLKVQRSKFTIVVLKSQNILTLKSDDRVVKTYRVSTGANDSTPAGTFKVTNKIVNPVWYTVGAAIPAGSPKNILGTRWLGISKEGYGIHGTTDPGAIGKCVTSGCVRLANHDVEELYAIVPEGTEVLILD